MGSKGGDGGGEGQGEGGGGRGGGMGCKRLNARLPTFALPVVETYAGDATQ